MTVTSLFSMRNNVKQIIKYNWEKEKEMKNQKMLERFKEGVSLNKRKHHDAFRLNSTVSSGGFRYSAQMKKQFKSNLRVKITPKINSNIFSKGSRYFKYLNGEFK